MEGKAKILLYGFSEEEERRIDQGLARLGVPPAQKLGPGQQGVVLRSLLESPPDRSPSDGEPAAGEPAAAPAGERLVLFHNLSDAGVRSLMGFIRGERVGRPIFAVVTPTSIGWTLGQLLAHLREERAALEKGR